ncbi:MAG: hypothetical protein A2750_04230 [Candidatus Yanofskybacteria bacterium RIFCSPHIGHO2_01_FULL_45_42]|uniref:Uncharacterized protein n=2 Tax=Candidatus Yanofskyibacteriota TaxID=1752733 RepID=A0A1F8FL69_9BACT|nr:MAG: hypothetical protein A2750_04230 [Candidatus Yanofskybacteria bacterium RIFCSPHIGHO2_01_FULL_45_42]OGN13470.1 MAG: hypothetical protein A3J47_03885 [Candidatus Yanofskybacteria bacterium RIFCSPHIGHO2_02_FULL_43_22]
MRSILEEKFNKHVKNELVYDFDISETGLYVIEISSQANGWLQNTLKLISFFQDDDLAVKIDNKEFPKLSGKRGLFDGEAAWNGNKLKGRSQINVFFIHLDAGKHTLRFIADQSPFLETVRIYQATNEQNIVFEPVKNYQIESGNRRPWLIFILVELDLERLKIQASADQKQGDDDDLQLKISGERQINDIPKSHKYWYWCGRVLKGQSRTFDKKFNLAAGLNYIELWADNTPTLEKVELTLAKNHDNLRSTIDIVIYTYRGVYGNEDYNRYDTLIKDVVYYWNNEFLNDTDPPKQPLDPNLVKAILYQESRVGYYSGAEVNIMQIGNSGDLSLETLKGELPEYWIHNGEQIRLEYPDAKIETVKDSIFWGVRWLYHKAQNVSQNDPNRRIWVTWKEAVERYGPPSAQQEYVNSVWDIYKNGIKKEASNLIKLWLIILVATLSFFSFAKISNEIHAFKVTTLDYFASERHRQIQNIETKYYKNTGLILGIIEWEKDWWEDLRVGIFRDKNISWIEIEEPPSEQSILFARFIELSGFSNPILEVYGITHVGHGNIYLYEVKDKKLIKIFKTAAVDSYNERVWSFENYQSYGYDTCGQIYEDGKLSAAYSDMNKDGVSDVVLTGKINVVCEERIRTENFTKYTDIKVSEMSVYRIYLWNKNDWVEVID